MDLQTRFEQYHTENPHVYEALVRLAKEARTKGKKRISIKMLFEVVRWEHFLTAKDPDGWRLNNNYHSRYARMIMDRVEGLEDIFEIRRLLA